MSVRNLALAALAGGLTVVALAATPAPVEKKTTTAHPVAVPSPPPAPQAPDASRGPGILDSSRDGEINGINQDITITAGETHDGDVTCIRGHVTIDGHVNGDVTVVAGSLDLRGSVDGDVTGVVSRPGARRRSPRSTGDVTNVGGTLAANGATVQGQVDERAVRYPAPEVGSRLESRLGSLRGFVLLVEAVRDLPVLRLRAASRRARPRPHPPHQRGGAGPPVHRIHLRVGRLRRVRLRAAVPGAHHHRHPAGVLASTSCSSCSSGSRCAGSSTRSGPAWAARWGARCRCSARSSSVFSRSPFSGSIPLPCVGFSIWFLVEILAFGYLILTRVGTRGTPVSTPPPRPRSARRSSAGTIASLGAGDRATMGDAMTASPSGGVRLVLDTGSCDRAGTGLRPAAAQPAGARPRRRRGVGAPRRARRARRHRADPRVGGNAHAVGLLLSHVSLLSRSSGSPRSRFRESRRRASRAAKARTACSCSRTSSATARRAVLDEGDVVLLGRRPGRAHRARRTSIASADGRSASVYAALAAFSKAPRRRAPAPRASRRGRRRCQPRVPPRGRVPLPRRASGTSRATAARSAGSDARRSRSSGRCTPPCASASWRKRRRVATTPSSSSKRPKTSRTCSADCAGSRAALDRDLKLSRIWEAIRTASSRGSSRCLAAAGARRAAMEDELRRSVSARSTCPTISCARAWAACSGCLRRARAAHVEPGGRRRGCTGAWRPSWPTSGPARARTSSCRSSPERRASARSSAARPKL